MDLKLSKFNSIDGPDNLTNTIKHFPVCDVALAKATRHFSVRHTEHAKRQLIPQYCITPNTVYHIGKRSI
jgi:hypothetical protein